MANRSLGRYFAAMRNPKVRTAWAGIFTPQKIDELASKAGVTYVRNCTEEGQPTDHTAVQQKDPHSKE